MSHSRSAKNTRHKLLGLIHLAVKRQGLSDTDYRAWLEREFGVRTSAKLNEAQLHSVVNAFRSSGWLDGQARGATGGEDRPTAGQWAKIAALSRELGWDGLEAPGLQKFVERVTKLSSPRFMTRAQARNVIAGMESWKKHRESNSKAQP
ncbi:MAG: regulatory protein GemA [Gammaproteobacteria bacterium]|nr:regulatory protein GemA [Gammaproteobacteria bacterium]MCP5416464.1 regulatory protein GemA [Chromatiaceae bacterium]